MDLPRDSDPDGDRGGDGCLGLASYAVDKETGVVTTQSSLALTTIGETYDAAIETGAPIQAEQIYPPLNRLTLQQIRQDPETIEYLVTVEWDRDNPADTRRPSV